MNESILQGECKWCFVCGSTQNTEKHHIYKAYRRDHSEEYGCFVYLCPMHHRGEIGVHGRDGSQLDNNLKRICQQAFEMKYSHEQFMEVFGKNYL